MSHRQTEMANTECKRSNVLQQSLNTHTDTQRFLFIEQARIIILTAERDAACVSVHVNISKVSEFRELPDFEYVIG